MIVHPAPAWPLFCIAVLTAGCAGLPAGNRYVNDRGDVWPEDRLVQGLPANAPLADSTEVVAGAAAPLVAVTGTHAYPGPDGAMLLLALQVLDEEIEPRAGISRVWLRRLVDDRGNELSLASPEDGVLWSPARDNVAQVLPGRVGGTALRRAYLRVAQPAGRVRGYRVMEGLLEYFDPAATADATVRLPAVPPAPDAAADPRLEQRKIEIVVLENDAVRRRAQSLAAALGVNPPNFAVTERSRVFFVRDPSRAILGFELQDAAGRPLAGQNSSGFSPIAYGGLATITVPAAIPDGAQLAVFLREPAALKARPFRVDNVVLP